jgi:GntR family transcriptional regulator
LARPVNAKLAVAPRALDGDVRTPLYNQIFLLLRNKILNGEYPNGAFLPSESELAGSFGVSRITAKRALNELAEAGLAVRQRGRGTRARNKGGGTIVSGSVESLVDSLRANARNQRVDVLEFGYVSPPPDVASALRLKPEAQVQRAVRVCSADGEPYSHLTTYIPAEIGEKWTAAELGRSGMMSQLARGGVPIAYADQVVTATLADGELAAALGVAIGSALIRAVRISFAKNDVPTEYLLAHYAPERYQFIMTMTNEAD